MFLKTLMAAALLGSLVLPAQAQPEYEYHTPWYVRSGQSLRSRVVFRAANRRYSVIIERKGREFTYTGQSGRGIITLRATRTRDGYEAKNGNTTYRVYSDGTLVVDQNGRETVIQLNVQ